MRQTEKDEAIEKFKPVSDTYLPHKRCVGIIYNYLKLEWFLRHNQNIYKCIKYQN